MRVKVISFYTRNTPYEQEAFELQKSCTHFGIDADIQPVASLGSWEKNVAFKPFFIREQRQKKRGPLLWVDADASFLQAPDFAPFLSYDFSVRTMEIFSGDPRFALHAGTLFINDTPAAHVLMDRWCERCSEKGVIPFLDQIALYEVLQEQNEATVYPMPIAYCKIYDVDSFFIDDEHVVIEQRQASRHLR